MFPNTGTSSVLVHGKLTLSRFSRKHAGARKSLARFQELARSAHWRNFPDVKATFPATDYTPDTGTLIFDIGGNKYRLVARVDFEEQMLWIDSIMTHEQYDRKDL
jgi:mRNA interferase HigB